MLSDDSRNCQFVHRLEHTEFTQRKIAFVRPSQLFEINSRRSPLLFNCPSKCTTPVRSFVVYQTRDYSITIGLTRVCCASSPILNSISLLDGSLSWRNKSHYSWVNLLVIRRHSDAFNLNVP